MRRNAAAGSAAIEFAFVAPIFFTLLFGILETGIMYFSQFTLQNATMVAARSVRTGNAQNTNYATAATCSGGAGGSGAGGAYANSQEWFKDQICCGISALLTCSNLHVNVQNYTGGFSGAAYSNSTDSSGKLLPVTDAYNPGNSCDVVLVRATYTWTVVTPVLSWFLVNMASNGHLLSSTFTFRNEPFTAGTTC
jgi:Flp pilus assembly protein TadG